MPQTARRLPSYLLERYRAWHALHYEENRSWYKRLVQDGQHPRTMMVTCCDSRFDPVGVFSAEPGEHFIVRNVASLIPPFVPGGGHHGTLAALEFAVTVLHVAHIVIVGHSHCGGVKACHDMCSGAAPELLENTSFVGRWMDILRPGYDRVSASIENDGTDAAQDRALRALEQEAVLVSLRNLETFPFVREAVEDGLLTLHGAWIDIASGKLHLFDPDKRRFAAIEGDRIGA